MFVHRQTTKYNSLTMNRSSTGWHQIFPHCLSATVLKILDVYHFYQPDSVSTTLSSAVILRSIDQPVVAFPTSAHLPIHHCSQPFLRLLMDRCLKDLWISLYVDNGWICEHPTEQMKSRIFTVAGFCLSLAANAGLPWSALGVRSGPGHFVVMINGLIALTKLNSAITV